MSLSQHPDEHRPQASDPPRSDRQLGEGPRLRIPPELADPVGAVEVGERQYVEESGAWSGAEAVEALTSRRSRSRRST
jgi:hypothetical protein